MYVDPHPRTVKYEYHGYIATIEMTCMTPEAPGPDQMTITIRFSDSWAHTMKVSSNYGSVEEAVEAAQGLVRHYVSFMRGPAA
ncbi:hypothetical protein [Pseudomonas sp. A2]|uniref:hypothetical protein n=1 Tax=Pseudomonas sp. A2 TaxID=107445 RepID=UPI001FFEE013|nr:hypothetical protein [Pseudomonas sp. A2]UPK86864.1 hypothetical protein E5221_18595 [Pseudomonas sp. A2]